LRIRVEVEVRPTESLDRIKQAIQNLFDYERTIVKKQGNSLLIVAEAKSPKALNKLHSLLRKQRILDASRGHIKRGVKGNRIVFYLNKQAAFMGMVSFCSVPEKESPLGPIRFEIECANEMMVEEFLDWLVPRTINGVPVGELKEPPKDS